MEGRAPSDYAQVSDWMDKIEHMEQYVIANGILT